jgi:hypothetical protein
MSSRKLTLEDVDGFNLLLLLGILIGAAGVEVS